MFCALLLSIIKLLVTMPSTCCVPYCKGNYKTGPRVSVYRFPQQPELRRKWLQAIKRKHFTPTRYSRVCELHFIPADYEHETSHFDERSGRRLTAKLDVPRLKKDAVPTQIPNCPKHLSSSVQARESPDTRKSENELLLDEDMDLKLEIKEEEVSDALTEFVNVLDHVEAVPSPKENDVDTLAVSKPSTCASPSNIQFVAINPPQLEIPSHLMEEAPVDVLVVTKPSIIPSTSSASRRKVNPTIPRNEDSDEFHLFGMFVASQLRALPLRDALQVQLEIQTIIAQKRSQSLT